MPSPSSADMESNSQYSSCETLDSHRSSECDEKNEVNGNAQSRKGRKVINVTECYATNFDF
jgi:hypothetical protein